MLKIQRVAGGESVVFVLSGRIETENVTQLESLITAEPTPIVFDLKDPTKGPR
jgi:hypothetical protein